MEKNACCHTISNHQVHSGEEYYLICRHEKKLRKYEHVFQRSSPLNVSFLSLCCRCRTMAQVIKKRKLNVADPEKEQFRALRQIVTLTQQDCRQIIALLQDKESSKTCSRSDDVYTQALPCLRELRVPLTEGGHLSVPCMSLVDLLQKKVNTCPLFAESLRRVIARDATHVRLAIYCDDAQGGNVMAAKASMKASLIYAIFLDFPILHMENLWITLAVLKARDVAKCKGGLASVMSELLCFYKAEFDNGLPIEITKGDPDLIFVPKIVYLADHEGLRASLGCKGAAGIKPCLKCFNILGLGRAGEIPNHFDIASTEHQHFRTMTQTTLNEVAGILAAQPNKKSWKKLRKCSGGTGLLCEKVHCAEKACAASLTWKASVMIRCITTSPTAS